MAAFRRLLNLAVSAALALPSGAVRQGKASLAEALEPEPLPLRCRERSFAVSRNGFKKKLELSVTDVGAQLEVACGPGTGVPDEKVTFRCIAGASGEKELGCYRPLPSGISLVVDECHWQHESGSCTDPQDMITTCQMTVYNITWTLGETRTPVSFTLPKTQNPDRKALELVVPCPPASPDPKASAKFVCGSDGVWREGDASPCASLAPPAPVAPTGSLPCKLEAKDVKLTNGEAGVQIQVLCSEAVDAAVLKLPNNLQDQAFGTLPAGKALLLLTYAKRDFAGKRVVLQGKAGGQDGAVEVVLPSEDTTSTSGAAPAAVPAGQLPCQLQTDLVDLVGGKRGFTVSVLCSAAVEGAVLKLPAGYQALSFGSLKAGVKLNLLTHSVDEFGGKQLVLEGTSNGSSGAVSVIVPGAAVTTSTAPMVAGELPCKLEVRNVQLQGGEPGFTVSVRCSQPLSGVLLKLGSGFQDLSFGNLAADATFDLLTQSRSTFGGKRLELQAKLASGAAGSLGVIVPPV